MTATETPRGPVIVVADDDPVLRDAVAKTLGRAGYEVVPAADGTAIRGDADSIAQAVSNLLDNALKYTPRGGTVAVEVRRDGGRVRVTVTNSGDGIAPHDLPFVFERFYRSEKSRSRESGGAGIGLSIVKEVATAHDGEVGATSGGGETVIWFSLPLGHRSGHPERA